MTVGVFFFDGDDLLIPAGHAPTQRTDSCGCGRRDRGALPDLGRLQPGLGVGERSYCQKGYSGRVAEQ